MSIFFLSVPHFSAHKNRFIDPSCCRIKNREIILTCCKRETNRFAIHNHNHRMYSISRLLNSHEHLHLNSNSNNNSNTIEINVFIRYKRLRTCIKPPFSNQLVSTTCPVTPNDRHYHVRTAPFCNLIHITFEQKIYLYV